MKTLRSGMILTLLLAGAAAQTIHPSVGASQVRASLNSWSRLRYRVKLMGRSYCGESSKGYLVAPQCRGRWAGNGARVNTWSVGPYGQWDLEVQEANGQKPPRRDKSVVGLPLSISSPGRKTNCGGGFLAGGPSFQCRGPGGVSFDGSRANRWVLEQVRDRPHRFHIRLAANSGCGAAYLGAARKCGAPMEDPKLGLYNRDDPKAFTEFQLLPVAPCGFAGADCTHTGQCCEFQGFRCYSGKCATRPMPPDGSPFAVVEQGPPVSLDVDVPAPKNDGGAAITRYDVTLESADGGERISYASRSDNGPTVSFPADAFPRLCGRRWQLWGTVTNAAGSSSATDGGTHTTADCEPPSPVRGLSFSVSGSTASMPLSLTTYITAPADTWGFPITGYWVRLEWGTGAEGITYEATSKGETTVSFPGDKYPHLCGRPWLATANATTSKGTSAEDQQFEVYLDKGSWLCPKPDPPVLVSTSFTDPASPPVRLNVVFGAPPRTWGFAVEQYAIGIATGTPNTADYEECTHLTTKPGTVQFPASECPSIDLCGKVWSILLSADTTAGANWESDVATFSKNVTIGDCP